MANYFNLTLDTLGPQGVTVKINSDAQYTTEQLVTLTIGTSDGSTSGYQVKIWGDVDESHNGDVKKTEGTSAWISYAASKQVKLSSGDGSKTIYLKLRDDVWNESDQASDSITLDTTAATVTITGPDVSKISKVSGKDTSSFSFKSDKAFVEYKVKVVASSSAQHTTGTTIGTAGGSSNMSGSGSFPADTGINCAIKGGDLEAADSGDGVKVVKVFVKDAAGNWNV